MVTRKPHAGTGARVALALLAIVTLCISALTSSPILAAYQSDPDFEVIVELDDPYVEEPWNRVFRAEVALLPDSKVLIWGGFTIVNGERRTSLARLNADGTLDASFGDSGLYQAFSMATLPDGRIYTAGSPNRSGDINRFLPDGTRDRSFQQLVTGFSSDTGFWITGALPDGRVYVSSNARLINPPAGWGLGRPIRLLPDGSFDESWIPTGMVLSEVLVANEAGYLYARQHLPEDQGTNGRVVRVRPDGTIDPTFAPYLLRNWPAGVYELRDGKLLLRLTDNLNDTHKVVRLLSDGSLDPSFSYAPDPRVRPYTGFTVLPDGGFIFYGQDNANRSLPETYFIQAYQANGAPDSSITFPPIDIEHSKLMPQPDGSIFVRTYVYTGTIEVEPGVEIDQSFIRITRLVEGPSSTPSPSPTATETPSSSATPTPSGTPTGETVTPTVSPSATASATATATAPAASPSATASATSTATATAPAASPSATTTATVPGLLFLPLLKQT